MVGAGRPRGFPCNPRNSGLPAERHGVFAVGAEEVQRARSSHSALALSACCVALLIFLCGLVGQYRNRTGSCRDG